MSSSLKLTAKLTVLDYSGEIVACGVSCTLRNDASNRKNRMICNLLRIIRFFCVRMNNKKGARAGFKGESQKLAFCT